MKQFLLACTTVAALLGFTSCGMNVLRGEGKKTTQSPSVAAFDGVDVGISSKIKITVTPGTSQLIELSGYENIIRHIKTEVKENTLHIYYDLDDTWTINDDDFEVRITVPELKSLSLSGSPEVSIHGVVSGSEFKLDISGACSVEIDSLNVDRFNADLSGLSQLEINGGSVKQASYEISGAGKIEAFPLQTDETSASISGTAKSEVTALRRLEATISGAGSIKYKGKPEVVQHISGIGSVEPE